MGEVAKAPLSFAAYLEAGGARCATSWRGFSLCHLLGSTRQWRAELYGKHRRSFRLEVYTEGQVRLPCPEATLDLKALYEGVELERA
ncbi:MAG: hypothetical protein ACK4G4_08625 [Thermus sp.]|uniref:hypothetical protein n=1 Tax=Thermus sp. TaxID=275 RepID=UPI00391D710F